ncbi:MAG: aminoglycoside phosphotransferase family protein [Thermomicrobiales bacterium]
MHPAGSEPSDETAGRIIAACGIAACRIDFLASGVQSLVWVVETREQRYALRIASPASPEPPSYESEFGIRQCLADLGGRVSRPVRTNRDVESEFPFDWSLDEFVDGSPDPAGQLTAAACRDLGRTLALLHRLPVEGYGPLENRRDRIVGQSMSFRDGIRSRLERPWPFSGESLDFHPIASVAPDLLGKIRPLEPEMLALEGRPSRMSVIHSDLHAGQLALSNGRLAALLDFGDALIGPPAWDIGSFAYFHGWEMSGQLRGDVCRA